MPFLFGLEQLVNSIPIVIGNYRRGLLLILKNLTIAFTFGILST
jgi:hypothetical protein